jgi:[acyl-carrier-protein] S-malonyltransferase
MLPAAERLRERLAATPLRPAASVDLYGVDVKVHSSAEAMRAALVKQLHTPVYWAATVRTLVAAGATRLIESGPGRVLTGLNRRVERNREVKILAIEDPKSLEEALAAC